jgi:hypothetical protein
MCTCLERLSAGSNTATRHEFNTKRSQSINLKTPFTLKSSMINGNNEETKRSGSAHHHRTSKTSSNHKDPLCNLNEHVSFSRDARSFSHQHSAVPILIIRMMDFNATSSSLVFQLIARYELHHGSLTIFKYCSH